MNGQVGGQDFGRLVGIASAIRAEYEEGTDPWEGSPLAWIPTRQSRQRGKIGEQLLAGWCVANGLAVTPAHSSQFDRVIHGYRVEIKASTLWQGGFYKFQQIRDQEYDLVMCLGISPLDAHCWVLPKRLLYQYVIGHMGQHGGRGARDTDWLTVDPTSPPEWLLPWGGTLSEALQVLIGLGSGPY